MESEMDLPTVASEVLAEVGKREDGASRPAVLALHGDLGAGKTTFTQELARQLGVVETVVSPTFVVMKFYDTTNAVWQHLVHIDAYRIDDIDEMRPLRFAEILEETNTMIVVEWAEKIVELMPEKTIGLHFTQSGTTRTLTLQ